ncbi:hypothetical protein G6F56_005710 [Rhizopus delemar]|nr:hypothetical protein G6F56_005710 [Rhizopus delemar]
MKINEEEIWKDFEFMESTNKFLKLKGEIMENICRRLDRRHSYEACLIHPSWSIAAIKVLWEAPRFDNATQIKKFMSTIYQIKILALLVRDVSLAFLEPGPDYFLPQHSAESTKMVAHPRLLGLLFQ